MRRQPYPAARLTKGIDQSLDALLITDQASPNLKMCRFHRGVLRKDLGWQTFSDTLREVPMHMDNFYEVDGTEHFMLWTVDYTYEYSTEVTGILCYDEGTGTFTAGNTITGGTSGATATIVAVHPAQLYLNNISGTFQDNEVIYEATYGSELITAQTDRDFSVDEGNWTGTTIVHDAVNEELDVTATSAYDGALLPSTACSSAYTNGSFYKLVYTVSNLSAGDVLLSDADLISRNYKINIQDGTYTTIMQAATGEGGIGFRNATEGATWSIDDISIKQIINAALADGTVTTVSDAWIPIEGCNTWTGDEDNQFYSTVMPDSAGTLIIISGNGKDYPYKWDGSTWAALGGIQAAQIVPWSTIVFNNYLLCIGTTEAGTDCPFRIRWSDTADPETWTGGNTGFFDLIDTSDWCVGAVLMGDKCFIFKERSVWELVYAGGTEIFEVHLVVDGVGSYAQSSIVSLGDELIFFGSDDVYLFDGVRLTSVGTKMFPLFYDTETKIVNHSKINRAAAVYVEELAEYWLCLPTGSSNPDWLVKYNFDEEAWTQQDLQCQVFGYYSAAASQVIWSAANTAWNSGDWDLPWRRKALPGSAPITIRGAANGVTYQDDRTEPSSAEMQWESKDFLFAHGERILEVRFFCRGTGDFYACYSTDKGVSYSDWETLTPSSTIFEEVVMYLNFTCMTLRVKIKTTTSDFELHWVEPWFIQRARSKELY